MKICLISHTYLPKIGGTEIAVHNLARSLVSKGLDVTVYTMASYDLDPRQLDYRLATYPESLKNILQGHLLAFCFLRLQKREKFDLVHVHKAQMAYYVARIKKHLGIPLVVTLRGGDVQVHRGIGYGVRLDRAWEKKIAFALDQADVITTVGSAMKNDAVAAGAQARRVVYIPNGVDLNRFDEELPSGKPLPLGENDRKIVLAVGRYHPKKGYEDLLHAAAMAGEGYEDFKLVIVGRSLERLRPLALKLGLEDKLVLLEEQKWEDDYRFPNRRLLSLYRKADVFVSSSLIEGFASVNIEAMAAGLPVILTKCSGNEDVMEEDEGCGYYVPVGDRQKMAEKMVLLLKDDGLRKTMGDRARQLVGERFDIQKISDQYINVYAKLSRP